MIDVTEAQRRYRAELEQALARAGGKTRKRTLRAMVRATTQYRGTVLNDHRPNRAADVPYATR